MERSLAYLPLRKRDDLQRVVDVVLAYTDDVEMIILFGSYARGGWKEIADVEPNCRSGHVSDYDILVVTSDPAAAYDTVLWQDVALECRRVNLSARVQLIAHDVDFVNSRLTEGQFFFKDIEREGKLLYDSGEITLAREKEFTAEERKRIAKEHFDEWFDSASTFYRVFQRGYEAEEFKNSAFQLHQSAEAAYKTLLLVLTNYCPHEHYLGVLGLMAEEHDSSFCDIFPRDTEAQREQFKHFDYAYIGARYDPKYQVDKEELDYFSPRVRRLLELTEEICQARIEPI